MKGGRGRFRREWMLGGEFGGKGLIGDMVLISNLFTVLRLNTKIRRMTLYSIES